MASVLFFFLKHFIENQNFQGKKHCILFSVVILCMCINALLCLLHKQTSRISLFSRGRDNMENTERPIKEYYTIDLLHIVKMLWKRVWAIALVGIITAVAGFCIASFAIAPKYASSVMLYVNNSSLSLGNTNFSISSSEITAAQSLVKTYIVMLKNRTTLNDVIEQTNVDYTYEELYHMIEASAVNDTEVLKVTVTGEDPYEAARIVNCIAEVLPERISEIIEGSSMAVVDLGVVNTQKVSPSITKYTAAGLALGVFLSALIIVIFAMLDDTIHDDDYVINTYNYPILAKIPDLVNSGNKPYGYYYQKKKPTNE